MNKPLWYLETERMKLREICADDEQNILLLDSDPDVMKYLTNGVPTPIEEVHNAIERTTKLFKKHDGKFGFWAAINKADNQFMGWFHFRPGKKDADNVSRIELGYRLMKKYWGRGFATEGSKALISKGFTEFNVSEVFAQTLKENIASQKVMKKVGMSFVREFFEAEHNEYCVEYALNRKDRE